MAVTVKLTFCPVEAWLVEAEKAVMRGGRLPGEEPRLMTRSIYYWLAPRVFVAIGVM